MDRFDHSTNAYRKKKNKHNIKTMRNANTLTELSLSDPQFVSNWVELQDRT